jgi:IclR family transcriptional regulator, KDG regulon repressor
MAYLTEERVKAIIEASNLAPFTARTITDPAVLMQELEKIRQHGYGISHGEWVQDASGVAAPVFGATREVIASLTISGPTQRFTRDTIEKYSREVVNAANEISRQMGYSSYHSTSYLRKLR